MIKISTKDTIVSSRGHHAAFKKVANVKADQEVSEVALYFGN